MRWTSLWSLTLAFLLALPLAAAKGLTITPAYPSVIAGERVRIACTWEGQPVVARWVALDEGDEHPRSRAAQTGPGRNWQLSPEYDYPSTRPGRYRLKVSRPDNSEPPQIITVDVLPKAPFQDPLTGLRAFPQEGVHGLPQPELQVIHRRAGEPFRLRWQPLGKPGEVQVLSLVFGMGQMVRRDVTGLDHYDLRLSKIPSIIQVESLAPGDGAWVSRIQPFRLLFEGVHRYSKGLYKIGGLARSGGGFIYTVPTRHTLSIYDPPTKLGEGGRDGLPGWKDGNLNRARFNTPTHLAVGLQGTIFIADTGNHVIRKLDDQGQVTTAAGQPRQAGHRDTEDPSAQPGLLANPLGLATDDQGNLYIADNGNRMIRRLDPQGRLATLQARDEVNGQPHPIRFQGPTALALHPANFLYVLDGVHLHRLELREGNLASRSVLALTPQGGLAFRADAEGLALPMAGGGALAMGEGGLYLHFGENSGESPLYLLALDAHGDPLGRITPVGAGGEPLVLPPPVSAPVELAAGLEYLGPIFKGTEAFTGILPGTATTPCRIAWGDRIVTVHQHPLVQAEAAAGRQGLRLDCLKLSVDPAILVAGPGAQSQARARVELAPEARERRGRLRGYVVDMRTGKRLERWEVQLPAAGPFEHVIDTIPTGSRCQVGVTLELEGGYFRKAERLVLGVKALPGRGLRLRVHDHAVMAGSRVQVWAEDPQGQPVPCAWGFLDEAVGRFEQDEAGRQWYCPPAGAAPFKSVFLKATAADGRFGMAEVLLLNPDLDTAVKALLAPGDKDPADRAWRALGVATADMPEGPPAAAGGWRSDMLSLARNPKAPWTLQAQAPSEAGAPLHGGRVLQAGFGLPVRLTLPDTGLEGVFTWRAVPSHGNESFWVTGRQQVDLTFRLPANLGILSEVQPSAAGNKVLKHQVKIRVNGVHAAAGNPKDDGRLEGNLRARNRLLEPWGMVPMAAGTYVLVADAAGHCVRGVDLRAEGKDEGITTVYGAAGIPGFEDGPAAQARFNRPTHLLGTGPRELILVDTGNHVLRRLDTTTQTVSTFAGTGFTGCGQGPRLEAQFNRPMGICRDAQNRIYVADTGNGVIRRITPGDPGEVITLAGQPGKFGHKDGDRATATFTSVVSVAYHPAEDCLYVLDSHRLRRVTLDGQVTTVLGADEPGNHVGPVAKLQGVPCLDRPSHLFDDGDGLVIVNHGGGSLLKVMFNGDRRVPLSLVSLVDGDRTFAPGLAREGMVWAPDDRRLTFATLGQARCVTYICPSVQDKAWQQRYLVSENQGLIQVQHHPRAYNGYERSDILRYASLRLEGGAKAVATGVPTRVRLELAPLQAGQLFDYNAWTQEFGRPVAIGARLRPLDSQDPGKALDLFAVPTGQTTEGTFTTPSHGSWALEAYFMTDQGLMLPVGPLKFESSAGGKPL